MNHLFIAPRAAIIPSGATHRNSYVGATPCGCPVCQCQYESSASNPRQGGLRLNRLSCGEE